MSHEPDQHSDPASQATQHAYFQLVHTLCSMLPPPLAETPEALHIRNQAAIARVAALAPANADEADIAAHCVAARAHAEEVMRAIRSQGGDMPTFIRLNAQYALMERTAIANRNLLLRLQTVRQRRETDEKAADADAWLAHIAASRMRQALDGGPLTAPPQTVVMAEARAPLPADPRLPTALPDAAPHRQAAPEPPLEPTPGGAAIVRAAQDPWPAGAVITRAAQEPWPSAGAVIARAPPEPPPAGPAPIPSAPPAPPAGAPARSAAPARRQGRRGRVADSDEPRRDLAAEADYYALIYPYRAGPIRQHGGLPPGFDFGPPDEDLVRAIVTGTSSTLRALDAATIGAA